MSRIFAKKKLVLERVSNEKRAPGCLGCIGDEKLPSCVEIIINP